MGRPVKKVETKEERIARLRAELEELEGATLPQDAPEPVPAPAPVLEYRSAPGGPPSGFMALVQKMRGQRAEPLADDPEASALDQAAEKLAAMHPIDRQAYLEELRAKGRREDLRKARAEQGLEELTDAELDELVGAGDA